MNDIKEQVIAQLKHFGAYEGDNITDLDKVLSFLTDERFAVYLMAKGAIEEAKAAKMIKEDGI